MASRVLQDLGLAAKNTHQPTMPPHYFHNTDMAQSPSTWDNFRAAPRQKQKVVLKPARSSQSQNQDVVVIDSPPKPQQPTPEPAKSASKWDPFFQPAAIDGLPPKQKASFVLTFLCFLISFFYIAFFCAKCSPKSSILYWSNIFCIR